MDSDSGNKIWIRVGIGVGILILALALFALSIEFSVANVAMTIVILIVCAIFVFMTSGFWRDFSFQKAGITILIIVALVLIEVLRRVIYSVFDFMSADQSFVTPVFLFLVAMAVSVYGKKFVKNPNDESIISFGWFLIPNIVIFGGMAAVFTFNGSWYLYAISLYLVLPSSMLALRIIKLIDTMLRLSLPSPAYAATQVFVMFAVADHVIRVVDVLTDFNNWWYRVAIWSGVLIGGWIMIPIRKKIMHLP